MIDRSKTSCFARRVPSKFASFTISFIVPSITMSACRCAIIIGRRVLFVTRRAGVKSCPSRFVISPITSRAHHCAAVRRVRSLGGETSLVRGCHKVISYYYNNIMFDWKCCRSPPLTVDVTTIYFDSSINCIIIDDVYSLTHTLSLPTSTCKYLC